MNRRIATHSTIAVLAFSCFAYGQSGARSREPLVLVPPGEGFRTAAGEKSGNDNVWLILGKQSGGRFAMRELKVSAPNSFRDPHVHTREDEGWYVIEGELVFQVGDRIAVAGPGTFVWAPRNIAHRYHVSKAPARYLLMFSPAGIEGLFDEVDEIRGLDVGTPEYARELERRRAKYGARAGVLPKVENR